MSRPSRQPANILYSNFWFVAADASARKRKQKKLRERSGEQEELLKALHKNG
jgi:hypothetical protein